MAVVGDGEDIDVVVANMLVATVKMATSLKGSSFHSNHIGTFLVEGADGNAVVLGDGLVQQLKHDRFHSVPSMVYHCILSELVVM